MKAKATQETVTRTEQVPMVQLTLTIEEADALWLLLRSNISVPRVLKGAGLWKEEFSLLFQDSSAITGIKQATIDAKSGAKS